MCRSDPNGPSLLCRDVSGRATFGRDDLLILLRRCEITTGPGRRPETLNSIGGQIIRINAIQNGKTASTKPPRAGPFLVRNAARISGDIDFKVAQDGSSAHESISATFHG